MISDVGGARFRICITSRPANRLSLAKPRMATDAVASTDMVYESVVGCSSCAAPAGSTARVSAVGKAKRSLLTQNSKEALLSAERGTEKVSTPHDRDSGVDCDEVA